MARNEDLSVLPESPGAYFLRDAEKNLLLADCTADLRAQTTELLAPERERTSELLAQLDYIEYEQTDDLLSAAARMCVVTAVEQPRLPISRDYCYLGVRFHEPPFTTISSFTLEDYYYVGPFRSRFFLHDVLATLAALRQTPVCDDRRHPCERLGDKRCMGFCVESTLSERLDYFSRHFLQPNTLLVDELHERQEKLLDSLAFEEAEMLNRQIKLLQRFYDHVCMAHATRCLHATIERSDAHYRIEQGRLAWMQHEKGRTQVLARPDNTQLTTREYLAFDTLQYAERRAVYLALKQADPDLLNNECHKSVQRFAHLTKGELHA